MPEPCEEGRKKWRGDDYMICLGGQWVLYQDAGTKNKPARIAPDEDLDKE